jgi:hypothetical protein
VFALIMARMNLPSTATKQPGAKLKFGLASI